MNKECQTTLDISCPISAFCHSFHMKMPKRKWDWDRDALDHHNSRSAADSEWLLPSSDVMSALDLTGLIRPRMSVWVPGVGNSDIPLLLAQRGCQVTATDISETAVDLTNQKAIDRGVSLTVMQQDILECPFPDAVFDMVLDKACLDVFVRLQPRDVQAVWTQMQRVLAPGGVAVVISMFGKQMGRTFAKCKWKV